MRARYPTPASTHVLAKRPRHWAHDLVTAWCAGQPLEPIQRLIPANDADLANTHARIFCQNIVFHARYTDDLAALGETMATWVEQYRARRKV